MPERKRRSAGFNPPRSEESRYTYSELKSLKQLLNETGLSFWIIAAGLGAIFEIGHIIWLAIRYVGKF